ncbi:hypothetical protein N7465_011384 [Penicillium sp. CMV-2018d]|nr:hypothetical protein N7465_011384 [Penicillium sp. CMV-2018d]
MASIYQRTAKCTQIGPDESCVGSELPSYDISDCNVLPILANGYIVEGQVILMFLFSRDICTCGATAGLQTGTKELEAQPLWYNTL